MVARRSLSCERPGLGGPARPISVQSCCEIKLSWSFLEALSVEGQRPHLRAPVGSLQPTVFSDAPEGRALHPPRVEAPRLSDGLSLVIFSLHSSLS